MENQPNNNQEQSKGTPLVADQVSEWGDLAQFQEPSVVTEQGKVTTAEEEEQKPADPVDEPNDDEYEEPAPVVTAVDPGPFVPKDYSFEVTIYDEEGKNGKPVKISSIDQFEELMEKDANFGSGAAISKAIRLASKMENSLERDQAEWQKSMDEYTKQKQALDNEQQQIQSIASEIGYLVSKGMLPAVDKKYESADWSDPEVAKQPGVKEQTELLTYMRKENASRNKAGLRPLTSILDAYNAMQLDVRHKNDAEAKKRQGEARREAGARVAGSSPAPVSSNVPKGIAVGRGGSLRDLDAGWSL